MFKMFINLVKMVPVKFAIFISFEIL